MEIEWDHFQLVLNLDVNLFFELGDLRIFSAYSRDSESNETIPLLRLKRRHNVEILDSGILLHKRVMADPMRTTKTKSDRLFRRTI